VHDFLSDSWDLLSVSALGTEYISHWARMFELRLGRVKVPVRVVVGGTTYSEIYSNDANSGSKLYTYGVVQCRVFALSKNTMTGDDGDAVTGEFPLLLWRCFLSFFYRRSKDG